MMAYEDLQQEKKTSADFADDADKRSGEDLKRVE
jgi:hypothetical protein